MTTMTVMRALDAELRKIGAAYSGTWTFAVTNLGTGEHISLNEDAVMPTASLIKTPILISLYTAIQEGRLALGDRTAYEPQHRSLGSGVLSLMTPGVTMTVRDAATLMMIISDNSATNMCIDLVGRDSVNDTMRAMGYERTTLFQRLGDRRAGLDPRMMSVSTAAEICDMMTRIARHELVSAEASEDMLRILRRNQNRAELSRLLAWNEMNMLGDPRERWVGEKGGSFLGGVRTSGAIFHGPSGEFAMGAFCEGGTAFGAGPQSEGNDLLGKLGLAAWRALAE